MPITIAGLQHAGVPGDVDANLRILADAAARASQQGARILVTPEMFVTGYNIGERMAELATPELVDRVANIASTAGITIVAGLPEPLMDGTIANTLVVVDSDGTVLLQYRKTHLFGELDRSLFVAGDSLPGPIEIDGVLFSFLICYDVEFPETVRSAALAGADAIIVPTAQMEPYGHIAEHMIPVRAWENQVYIVYVNHAGSENGLRYVGLSSIVDPCGTTLASVGGADSSGLMIATIDPAVTALARRDNPYLADRRPELY